MSIEMGARGGMIAPDQKTFDYLKGRMNVPSGDEFCVAVEKWKKLVSDNDAQFDMEYSFNGEEIPVMITYGTNPGMAMPVSASVPSVEKSDDSPNESIVKALNYMGLRPGEKLLGKKIDYVFLGSCTNGRIEDLRVFAGYVKGKKKAPGVTAWIVPGSKLVEKQALEEGLVQILNDAGFEFRQPGCSACLAMNDDKVPEGKYCVSTSNRNFEGRQGPGSRTFLAGPLLAAAAAVTGEISNPAE